MFFSTGFEACRIAKDLGYKVTLICRDFKFYLNGVPLKDHPLGLADTHIEIETNNAESLIQYLEEYSIQNPFDGIVTFSDYYVDITSKVASHFGLPSSSPTSILTAKHKDKSRLCFQEKKVASPKFQVVNSMNEAYKASSTIGYPCIVKPTAESSSYGVRLVSNDEELAQAFTYANSIIINERGQQREGKVLIEEYMDGEEVSVETITTEGETYILGITSKGLTGWPNFVECEFSFPYTLEDQTYHEVINLVKKGIESIGYSHGPCHTEVRLTEDGPKIVEINPRIGGRFISEMIEDSLGINPFREVIKLTMGEALDLNPKKNAGAAWCAITAHKTGILKKITGEKNGLNSLGVKKLKFTTSAGNKVRIPSHNGDSIGYIYTVGKNAEEARKHLRTALDKVELVIIEESTGQFV